MLTTAQFCISEYGEKLYKICLDGGFSCPNRDGRVGRGGCVFCSAAGSGDFAAGKGLRRKVFTERENGLCSAEIDQMIESAKSRVSGKYKGKRYIAYFQAFTGTYAPADRLRALYEPVIRRDDIAVLSIATRPDCLDEDVLALIGDLNRIKPVWIELGLQTTKEESVRYINRCYDNPVYFEAVRKLNALGVHTITHVIIGLPGESREDIRRTVRDVVSAGSAGIKLQLLHVLEGTRLAEDYAARQFDVLSMEEYLDILKKILPLLPEETVVHRLTGDAPKKILIAPTWSADKKRVLNAIRTIL